MGNDVADLVLRSWEGEVLGEALFGRLADVATDPDRADALRLAERLEAQTRAVVERLADALGVALAGADEQRARGTAVADALTAMGWTEQMQAIAGSTGGYRALYESLGEALGGDHQPELDALLAHERALHGFAAAEAEGRDGRDDLRAGLVGAADV